MRPDEYLPGAPRRPLAVAWVRSRRKPGRSPFLALCVLQAALAAAPATAAMADALLSPIPEQRIAPGGLFEMEIRTGTGGDIALMIERAPVDATLRDLGNGAWLLRWPTPVEVAPASRIRLMAVDRGDRSRRTTREVVIRRAEYAVARIASAPLLARATASPLEIPAIADQRLSAGAPWSLRFRALGDVSPSVTDDTARVTLEGAPEGLAIEAEQGGWYRLSWRPDTTLSGSVRVDIVAYDSRDPSIESRTPLRFEILSASDALPDAPPDAPPEEIERDDWRAPSLEPLPTQIVSAGSVVKFDVRAETAPDDVAILQIDRLPPGSSFDERADGSRAFYWPTGDGDQGEHHFRVTAISAADASLKRSVEVLVVVGDPTRGKTVPATRGQP